MNENTVFTVPTGQDYYGDATVEEAQNAAEFGKRMIAAYCDERGYDVEFRIVPEATSYNNRSHGDEEIIAELDNYVEQNWEAWTEASLTPESELLSVMTIAEITEQFDIEASTVRRTCINGWVRARKSGDTWLLLRDDVIARWGGKARSIALLLTSLGLTWAIWQGLFA
jgi:hypothetical protein